MNREFPRNRRANGNSGPARIYILCDPLQAHVRGGSLLKIQFLMWVNDGSFQKTVALEEMGLAITVMKWFEISFTFERALFHFFTLFEYIWVKKKINREIYLWILFTKTILCIIYIIWQSSNPLYVTPRYIITIKSSLLKTTIHSIFTAFEWVLNHITVLKKRERKKKSEDSFPKIFYSSSKRPVRFSNNSFKQCNVVRTSSRG